MEQDEFQNLLFQIVLKHSEIPHKSFEMLLDFTFKMLHYQLLIRV